MVAGRPRTRDVEREPSGRISRKKSGGLYAVYVAYLPTCRKVKVGRTGNVQARMTALGALAGERPVLCSEFFFRTADDSVSAETDLIEFLMARGYSRDGKEWFSIPTDDLPGLVNAFGASCRAISINSFGSYRDHCPRHGEKTYRMLFGHKVNEARL